MSHIFQLCLKYDAFLVKAMKSGRPPTWRVDHFKLHHHNCRNTAEDLPNTLLQSLSHSMCQFPAAVPVQVLIKRPLHAFSFSMDFYSPARPPFTCNDHAFYIVLKLEMGMRSANIGRSILKFQFQNQSFNKYVNLFNLKILIYFNVLYSVQCSVFKYLININSFIQMYT